MRLDLTFMMSDTYNNPDLKPFRKFTSSSKSTRFEDILPWNISQMITKTVPISIRIVMNYVMKQGIPYSILHKINGNWDKNVIRISQWRKNRCRTNTTTRRKKEIQNSRTVKVSQGPK